MLQGEYYMHHLGGDRSVGAALFGDHAFYAETERWCRLYDQVACLFVCVFVCMCVCVCVFVYVCMFVYICVFVCILSSSLVFLLS